MGNKLEMPCGDGGAAAVASLHKVLFLAPFALGCYIHGDGHSPLVNQLGWGFGTFFLLACLVGLWATATFGVCLGVPLLSKSNSLLSTNRRQGLKVDLLLFLCFLGAVLFLYFLGALAGDLYYYMH